MAGASTEMVELVGEEVILKKEDPILLYERPKKQA